MSVPAPPASRCLPWEIYRLWARTGCASARADEPTASTLRRQHNEAQQLDFALGEI